MRRKHLALIMIILFLYLLYYSFKVGSYSPEDKRAVNHLGVEEQTRIQTQTNSMKREDDDDDKNENNREDHLKEENDDDDDDDDDDEEDKEDKEDNKELVSRKQQDSNENLQPHQLLLKGRDLPQIVPASCDRVKVVTRFDPHFSLCLHPRGEFVSDYFNDDKFKDCDILPELAKLAKPIGQAVVVDVGANIGACTTLLASKGHKIFSFEPVSENHRRLYASLLENGFDNVFLIPAGASDKFGTVTIQKESNNRGNSIIAKSKPDPNVKTTFETDFDSEEIRLVMIDEVVKEHVHLLKIDVQGHELFALSGAKTLLNRYKVDVIQSEFWLAGMRQQGVDPRDYLNFLFENGYPKIYVNGRLWASEDIESMLASLSQPESDHDLYAISDAIDIDEFRNVVDRF